MHSKNSNFNPTLDNKDPLNGSIMIVGGNTQDVLCHYCSIDRNGAQLFHAPCRELSRAARTNLFPTYGNLDEAFGDYDMQQELVSFMRNIQVKNAYSQDSGDAQSIQIINEVPSPFPDQRIKVEKLDEASTPSPSSQSSSGENSQMSTATDVSSDIASTAARGFASLSLSVRDKMPNSPSSLLEILSPPSASPSNESFANYDFVDKTLAWNNKRSRLDVNEGVAFDPYQSHENHSQFPIRKGAVVCCYCHQMIRENDLKKHLNEVHLDKLEQCLQCKMINLLPPPVLPIHFKKCHNPNFGYVCTRCNQNFVSLSHFALHREKCCHNPVLSYHRNCPPDIVRVQCTLCRVQCYLIQADLKQHIATFHNPKSDTECERCGCRFSLFSMSMHRSRCNRVPLLERRNNYH